jgi:hypothetical protein
LKENKEKKTRNARHQKCINKKKQDLFYDFLVSVHYIKGEWKMPTRTNKQNILQCNAKVSLNIYLKKKKKKQKKTLI